VPAVATGTAATSVTVKGSRLVTVSTTAGDIHPGVAVFATGISASQPLPEAAAWSSARFARHRPGHPR
jgi:hypothetical protein